MPVGGQTRKVLVRPERNGYVYVMDRTSGQVLSANPYVHITTSKGVDLQTGRLIYNEEKNTERVGTVVRDISPASPGGKDWNPFGLLAAHGTPLHPAQQPLRRRRERRDGLHR